MGMNCEQIIKKHLGRDKLTEFELAEISRELKRMARNATAGRAMGSMYAFRTFSHSMINMWLWALKNQGKEGAMFTAKSIGATIALGGLTAFPFYATPAALC